MELKRTLQQQEEWKNIDKSWDQLMREKEEADKEKPKSSGNYGSRRRQKRHFSKFEKFDLENFERNIPRKVLNISSTASKDDINKAYKILIKNFHPDKFQNEKNVSKIKEAHKIACLLEWAIKR